MEPGSLLPRPYCPRGPEGRTRQPCSRRGPGPVAATGHAGPRKERSRTDDQQRLSPQVPNNQHVKVHFKAFFLLEPNVPLGSCSKDYVEINGER